MAVTPKNFDKRSVKHKKVFDPDGVNDFRNWNIFINKGLNCFPLWRFLPVNQTGENIDISPTLIMNTKTGRRKRVNELRELYGVCEPFEVSPLHGYPFKEEENADC